jgi:hypothetical protein
MADPYLWLILPSGASQRQYSGYWKLITENIPIHFSLIDNGYIL